MLSVGGNTATYSGDISILETAGNGAYTFDAGTGGSLTVSGGISSTGDAGVAKTGGGVVIFTGDNDYSGGTTISGGTLRIGNNTATGSIEGDVVNNSNLEFARSNANIFSGDISGSGSVQHTGDGTTTLTGTNSYKGTTTVSAGTLLVNGDQSGATGPVTVTSGATLGGTGTIGGSTTTITISDGGKLAPGASIESLVTPGNMSFDNGSIFRVRSQFRGRYC